MARLPSAADGCSMWEERACRLKREAANLLAASAGIADVSAHCHNTHATANGMESHKHRAPDVQNCQSVLSIPAQGQENFQVDGTEAPTKALRGFDSLESNFCSKCAALSCLILTNASHLPHELITSHWELRDIVMKAQGCSHLDKQASDGHATWAAEQLIST